MQKTAPKVDANHKRSRGRIRGDSSISPYYTGGLTGASFRSYLWLDPWWVTRIPPPSQSAVKGTLSDAGGAVFFAPVNFAQQR